MLPRLCVIQTGERHQSKWAASAPPVSKEYITPILNWNILNKNIEAEISEILRICSYNPCHAVFERQSLKLNWLYLEQLLNIIQNNATLRLQSNLSFSSNLNNLHFKLKFRKFPFSHFWSNTSCARVNGFKTQLWKIFLGKKWQNLYINTCEINFYPNLFIQVLNGNQSRTPVSSAYNYENNYFKNLCD